MKAKDHSPKLDRQLGLFDSTMMVIGIVIGSGIFMTTGLMADALPSASLILIA
jgi:APA family basic amino acid/polyamine antiporter